MSLSIEPLKNGDSIYKIIETINALVKEANPNTNLSGTLSSEVIGEKIQFTATKDTFITGEVFTISTPGLYQITAKGKGNSKFAIKHIRDDSYETSPIIFGYYVSKEYLLSSGDKVFFWAVGSDDEKLTIILSLTGSFFDIVSRIIKRFPEILDNTENFPPYLPDIPSEAKDGKSAYDFALEGGYMGSEEEFQEQLSTLANRAWIDLSNVSQDDFTAKWEELGISTGNWVSVAQFENLSDFPAEGKSTILYIERKTNMIRRWDADTKQYVIVGSDYLQIKQINGGNANG